MRAAVYRGNQQFAIEDLADPDPSPGQVVVDVEFCAICGTDVHAFLYDIAPTGSVLGHEYSGVISRVGAGVERWKVGDRVIGGGGEPPPTLASARGPRFNYRNDGFPTERIRAYAEKVLMEEWEPISIPEGVSSAEAALCEPCAVAVHAVRISKASHEIILPGQSQIWEFQIQTNIVEEINKKPIYLRFKFNADDEYDPKSHTLWFAVGEGTNKRWPPEGAFKEMNRGSSAFHEEQLPIGIVPDKGPQNGLVRVHLMNRNAERPIIFLMEDGPMILYHDGGFGMNLFRGLLIIYFWLGLISAIGLMASSFLSFPVATFMSLGILLISASTGTLEQIIEEGGITGINHETGKKDESSMLDGTAIFFAKGAVKITTSIWGYSPVHSLSDGRTIKWSTLLSAFVWIVLIMSGLGMAGGVYMRALIHI